MPFLDEVFSAGATPKLQLIDRWGGAAKATKLADLEHEGPLEIMLGVLTIGGTAAAEVKVAGLGAKLGPPSGMAAAIDKLSVRISGTAADHAVDRAVEMAGLKFRP